MSKRCVLVMVTSLVLLLPFRAESGSILAPPIPARIGGTVTVDGTLLTQDTDDGYTFKVTKLDDTDYVDFNNEPAQDTDGLNSSDWYLIDIPIYDATDQPGGANPGDTAVLHIYKDGAELTVTSPANGQFTVGDSGSTTQIDLVATTNQPPTADAGPDQTAFVGDTVTLDGSGSSDVDGDPLTYQWSFSSRPGGSGATLSDTTAVNPTFQVDVAGTYVVQLIVNDGIVDSDPDTVTISTENSKPVADAGPDQTSDEGVTVTLDGSNSSDPDLGDSIASYVWTQTEGTSVTLDDPTAVKPTFTAPDVGPDGESLTFQLTVTDNGGLQSTDTCIVNVTWENDPPTADAGPDQTSDEGVTVTLDGSNSTDTDDGVASYLWTQTAGTSITLSDPTAVQPTFSAPDVGPDGESLTFQLTVTDNGGLQSTDTCIVNVTWENAPPIADAGPDQTVGEGEMVTLDGSNSSDPDPGDSIASYLWTQTEGTSVTLDHPTAVKPTFTAPDVGPEGEALTFQLTVTDDGGLKGTDTCVVDVINVPAEEEEDKGGGACPIVIAAFGSPLEGLVDILRKFRDAFLLPTRLGCTFVAAYYRYSPPVADFMVGHEGLRAMVRWSLLPVIGVSWMALHFGPWVTLALMGLLISVMVGCATIAIRSMRLRRQA